MTAQTRASRRGQGETRRAPFVLQSEEGLPIRGVVETPPKARAAAILLHGFKGFANWGFFPWLCEQLNEAGVATCRFDFSRNGVGEDGETFDRLDLFADDTYSIALSDLRVVARHFSAQTEVSNLPVSLFGFSRGGGLALVAAPEMPTLRSVVTWSAVGNLDRWDAETVARWRRDGFVEVENSRTGQMMRMSTALLDDFERDPSRFDVLAHARALTVPLLAVHGADDETVSVDDARAIAAENELASLLVVSNASHTYGATHPLVHVTPALLAAARVTSRFLAVY